MLVIKHKAHIYINNVMRIELFSKWGESLLSVFIDEADTKEMKLFLCLNPSSILSLYIDLILKHLSTAI